eukprot:COSAG02_NODE_10625_length_1897_cov_8.466073_1_plen_55_part_00
MEPYLDALRARDVVAVHSEQASGYELAYLTNDHRVSQSELPTWAVGIMPEILLA